MKRKVQDFNIGQVSVSKPSPQNTNSAIPEEKSMMRVSAPTYGSEVTFPSGSNTSHMQHKSADKTANNCQLNFVKLSECATFGNEPGEQQSDYFDTLQKRGSTSIHETRKSIEQSHRPPMNSQRVSQPIFGKKKYNLQKTNFGPTRNQFPKKNVTNPPVATKHGLPSSHTKMTSTTSIDRELRSREFEISGRIKQIGDAFHQRPNSIVHNVKDDLLIQGKKNNNKSSDPESKQFQVPHLPRTQFKTIERPQTNMKVQSQRAQFSKNQQNKKLTNELTKCTVSKMTPVEYKDTLREESLISSKQGSQHGRMTDSQRANIVVIKDQQVPTEMFMSLIPRKAKVGPQGKVHARDHIDLTLQENQLVPPQELLIGMKINAQTAPGAMGANMPFKTVALADFISTSQQNQESSVLSQGSADPRYVKAYPVPNLKKMDHVPHDLQSFALLVKKNKCLDSLNEKGNNVTFVGESILSPDNSKDNNQFSSTNQTDRAYSFRSDNNNQKQNQDSNQELEVPVAQEPVPLAASVAQPRRQQPISNSDRLQDFGVKTSNLTRFKTNWIDEENIKHATEILSKLEQQADRMSHGYDRHGFERGKKTHFKAKRGKLFDTEDEEPIAEGEFGPGNNQPMTQMPTDRKKLFFDKRNNRQQVVSKRAGHHAIVRSLNTSKEDLRKSWNKETTFDSLDDNRSSLKSKQEYGQNRQPYSSHFDMSQIPLSRRALFEKYSQIAAMHLMDKGSRRRHHSRQFLTIKMDHRTLTSSHLGSSHATAAATANMSSTLPSAAAVYPRAATTIATTGGAVPTTQKLSPRIKGRSKLSPVMSSDAGVAAERRKNEVVNSLVSGGRLVQEGDGSKNMGSRIGGSTNFIEYQEKMQTFSVVDAVASDVASDLSPKNTARHQQLSSRVNENGGPQQQITATKAAGQAEEQKDQAPKEPFKINVNMEVKEKQVQGIEGTTKVWKEGTPQPQSYLSAQQSQYQNPGHFPKTIRRGYPNENVEMSKNHPGKQHVPQQPLSSIGQYPNQKDYAQDKIGHSMLIKQKRPAPKSQSSLSNFRHHRTSTFQQESQAMPPDFGTEGSSVDPLRHFSTVDEQDPVQMTFQNYTAMDVRQVGQMMKSKGRTQQQLTRFGNSSPPMKEDLSPTRMAPQESSAMPTSKYSTGKSNVLAQRQTIPVNVSRTGEDTQPNAAAYDFSSATQGEQPQIKRPKEIDRIVKKIHEQVYLNKKFLPRVESINSSDNASQPKETFYTKIEQVMRLKGHGVDLGRRHSNNVHAAVNSQIRNGLIHVKENPVEQRPLIGRDDPSIVSLKDACIQPMAIQRSSSSRQERRIETIGISAPSSSTRDRHASQDGWLCVPELPQLTLKAKSKATIKKHSKKKGKLAKHSQMASGQKTDKSGTQDNLLTPPKTSSDKDRLKIKKGQSVYDHSQAQKQVANDDKLAIRKITSSPQVMIKGLGLRKDQSTDHRQRQTILAATEIIDEHLLSSRPSLVGPPIVVDPRITQKLASKLQKQQLRETMNKMAREQRNMVKNEDSSLPPPPKEQADSSITPAVHEANTRALLMDYQLRATELARELQAARPEGLTQQLDSGAEDDDGENDKTALKIKETARFMRRLNNRLVQHVLVEGGSGPNACGKNPQSSQEDLAEGDQDDDRFVDVHIGLEKEIEVFPQSTSETGFDVPDNLPVLFRIHGLEEGKKYIFAVRSSLMRKMKTPMLSGTVSPNSPRSRKVSVLTPPLGATIRDSTPINDTRSHLKSRATIKVQAGSTQASPTRIREMESLEAFQFQEVLPLQDVKIYMSSKVTAPSATTQNDYQLLIENLNIAQSNHEMKINIKERPSWLKDEAFQDDTIYGSLLSQTGCFVKILVRDAEQKKERKKEVPVQPQLTPNQIYEQKQNFRRQVIRIVKDLREYFRQNVQTADQLDYGRQFIQRNINELLLFSKEERMLTHKMQNAKRDAHSMRVLEKASQMQQQKREAWITWMNRWNEFRHNLEYEKEALCQKIKRVILVKRLLTVEKMTIFVKKLKQIYQLIKIKARRQEASLYISIKAFMRLRRLLMQRGPTFDARQRRFHLRPKFNFYAVIRHDHCKNEAKKIIKQFLFRNGMLTAAIKAQFVYLDKIVSIQRFYRNQQTARGYLFRFHRQQIDKQRGFLYDVFNKKKEQTPISKKILKKSHIITSVLLDDMIKIFLDYKQELSNLKHIQFMLMVYEVQLKFLGFLRENPECVNRAKTGMVGVEQKAIDDFINNNVSFVAKEQERLKINFAKHKALCDQHKKLIFVPARDAQVTFRIHQKSIQATWQKKYRKKKNVMVLSYLEMKQIAVENEKKMREKKVLIECAVTGESKEEVEERLRHAKKRCCPELPEYNVADDPINETNVLNEHKQPCEQCEALRNQAIAEEQPPPVSPTREKKGKKGKSPDKREQPPPAEPKDPAKEKKLEEIECDDCKAEKAARVERLLEEVSNQYTGHNFRQLFNHYHLQRLATVQRDLDGKSITDPSWPSILRTEMIDIHKMILKACNYEIGQRLFDTE